PTPANVRHRRIGGFGEERLVLRCAQRDELRLPVQFAPHVGERAVHERAALARIESGRGTLELTRIEAMAGEGAKRTRRLIPEERSARGLRRRIDRWSVSILDALDPRIAPDRLAQRFVRRQREIVDGRGRYKRNERTHEE